MVIVKVLKRKDGAALVVGVVVALIVATFLTAVTTQLTTKISNIGLTYPTTVSTSWRASYFTPFVALVIQLLALEVLIRIYVMIHESVEK